MADYSVEDKAEMVVAHQSRDKSRLQELINFIKVSGFSKIGIANCLSMQKYADKLLSLLQAEGFNVFAINCKTSGLQGEMICKELNGPSCDPISQAEYLNANETDFNINVGLCLGHGLLFQKYSNAPVTTFVVKDVVNGHNPIEYLR